MVALDVATETAPDGWNCRECGAACRIGTAYCGGCGARWAGTRAEDLRLVTALFADISGFTTLADTLEVEDLHDVINPLIAGLARIAEKYDGFINKYAGDALLVIYGAPVAHEDDAQRALLSALEMHAALPTLLEQIGPAASHLTIHVGVNTGKVVAGRVGSDAQGDYSVLGDSVILAQRLESVCPSGQTYVGPATYELCKDEFDFESVGELTLKGKLKPVEGHRLVGRRRSGTATERPLVGRGDEIAVIDEVLDIVEQGSGVVLSLSGEPGTGKSRLLAEARTRATSRGTRWLPARCLSYGSSLPYWPFADLLRQALGLRVEDPPEETRARLWDALPAATMVGAERLLGLPVESVGPEQARREIHDALAAWLAMLAERAPVVLSVEDTHWADAATLEVLGELIRTTGGSAVGIVLTCRPEGVDAVHSLASEADHRHLPVVPLGPEAVGELAGDVLGLPAGVGLLGLLGERTLGNPLFVEELCRSLQETGALVETSAGTDLRPGYDVASVPATVERVFTARVDLLPAHALELISTCAVIGRMARLSLIREVTGDDPRSTLDLLVELGMLDHVVDSDEPALAFHHALLHDVVYGRILRKRRRTLHRLVADVGRRLYGDSDITVDLLARHLYLADAGEEAVEPLLRAGRRAAQLYANDTAALHFERAVEVLQMTPAADHLPTALTELARVQELRGAYDEALVAFERARTSPAGPPAAWNGSAAVLRKLGRYAEALEVARAGPQSPELLLELSRSTVLSGDPVGGLAAVREALRTANTVAERAGALLELVCMEAELDHPEFAVSHGRKALALLEAVGDARAQAKALRLIGDAERRLRRYDAACSSLLRAVELAHRVGDIEEAGGALLNLGIAHSESGRTQEAEQVTLRAAQLFERMGHASGRALAYGNLADFVLAQGDFPRARTWAERARDVAANLGYQRQVAVATLTLAEIAVAASAPAEALELLSEARADFERLAAPDMVEYCDRVAAAAEQASRGPAAPTPST